MEKQGTARERRELRTEGETTLLPFLLEKVQGKSRNAVKNLLTRRQVLVDGRVATRHDTPVLPGQVVTLLPQGQEAPPELPFPICYEDDDLLAIEKPAGLLTVATCGPSTPTGGSTWCTGWIRIRRACFFSPRARGSETPSRSGGRSW